MSSNLCLNQSQSQYSKFMIDDREDKTRSTQNFSKLCQNCRLIKDQLQGEILLLKDKSHQSFMQVIQVQQLHQEEMELMNLQHQQETTSLRQQITKLQQQVSRGRAQLLLMQKNFSHHICHNMQSLQSFLIQNIQIIQCNEDKSSRLDESSFCQFNQIVEGRDQFGSQGFLKLQRGQKTQKNKSYNNTGDEEKIAKLNLKILDLEREIESLFQINQQLKKQCTRLQTSQKSTKNNYQSLYKQSKFMADHIRTLANDKFKLQRKTKQLQKEIRDLKMKGLKKSVTFQDKTSNVKNGVGMFASQEYQNVKCSLESSVEYKDKEEEGDVFLSQVVVVENEVKNRQPENVLARSELLQVNSTLEPRKSMPSYKKVSHISPSPNFKKPAPITLKQKSSEFLKTGSQQFRQDVNKSDFMDEIRKQIQLKSLKKTIVLPTTNEANRPPSLFHDITKKRSSTKH